jgi:replicative DNA helicase
MTRTADPVDAFSSVETENMLIGALLFDRDAIVTVVDTLTPEDFTSPGARAAYEAALRLWNRPQKEAPDILSISEELRAAGKDYPDIDTLMSWMTGLNGVGYAIHAPFYAARIARLAKRRRFVSAMGEQIMAMHQDPDLDPMDALGKVAEQIAGDQVGTTDGPRSFADLVPETVQRIEDERHGLIERLVTPLGFHEIDDILGGGLSAQDLCILAARSSMGKTALASAMMYHAAETGNVLMFSLEMGADAVVRRTIGREGGVSMTTIKQGTLSPEEFDRFMVASEEASRKTIWIDDTPGLTTERMIARAQRLKAAGKLSLVVIDYMELIGDGNNSDREVNQQARISKIVGQLKFMARICNVPVIVLCQVSRDVDLRQDKMPTLAHLRWSAMIEQTADEVFFLTAHDRYVDLGMEEPDEAKRGVVDVLLAKHRNGKIGRFELYVDAETMKYQSARPAQQWTGKAYDGFTDDPF